MKSYLSSVQKQFQYYRSLGEAAFDQVSDDKLFWQINKESNSIAMIVKHMHGNMMSRWTDFLSSDGEKEWRQRDAEFDDDIQSRGALLDIWNEGWQCLLDTISNLEYTDLEREIYIRNMGHTVIEAINRQLSHYAYHVGQIVYIAKAAQSSNWHSLSIPKGQSKQYNDIKFSVPKRKIHFTDDL